MIQGISAFVCNGDLCSEQQKERIRIIFGRETWFGKESETRYSNTQGWITIPLGSTSEQIDHLIDDWEQTCAAYQMRFRIESLTIASIIAAGGLMAISAAVFLKRRIHNRNAA